MSLLWDRRRPYLLLLKDGTAMLVKKPLPDIVHKDDNVEPTAPRGALDAISAATVLRAPYIGQRR